jgi:hypothetical protein
MEEQLISFETAKLAKEKGFNIECETQFHDKGIFQLATSENTFERPTQSLLQRWLREVHKIQINVFSEWCKNKNKVTFSNYITSLEGIMIGLHHVMSEFDTYEEALEKGLLKALELIKQ